MDGNQRREALLKQLKEAEKPISGEKLAKQFGVSRQVIVQDIALLRMADHEIFATNRGYVCSMRNTVQRVFHVNHKEDEIQKELNLITDFGACVKDVFIKHENYGTLRAELNVHTRKEAEAFQEKIRQGSSGPLMTITSGDHYHTVTAGSEEILDEIEAQLEEIGFLQK